ncbi:hypothetical protein, partial [[Kitasatospora] papulosa]
MHVEFFPVVVTELSEDDDHVPLLVDPAAARVVRAEHVRSGDTVLASFNGARNHRRRKLAAVRECLQRRFTVEDHPARDGRMVVS